MELWVGGWAGVSADQQRKWPVLVAKCRPAATRCVFNGARLEEAIELQVGATSEMQVGNHSSLRGSINGEHA